MNVNAGERRSGHSKATAQGNRVASPKMDYRNSTCGRVRVVDQRSSFPTVDNPKPPYRWILVVDVILERRWRESGVEKFRGLLL